MTLTTTMKQEVIEIERRGNIGTWVVNKVLQIRCKTVGVAVDVTKGLALTTADLVAHACRGADAVRLLVERIKRQCKEYRPLAIQMFIAMYTALLVLLMAGCEKTDPYVEKFQTQIAIGDSRSHVIEVMGTSPNSLSSIELPLIRVEQLVWKAPNGHIYIIHTVMNKVLSKSAIQ